MYNMEKIIDEQTAKKTTYIVKKNTFFMIYYNTVENCIIVFLGKL
tara:strand:+ start:1747 stop:1881 length:135 start_codon:yes stop_codon:yes gene_type:complete